MLLQSCEVVRVHTAEAFWNHEQMLQIKTPMTQLMHDRNQMDHNLLEGSQNRLVQL